jgi:transmembrane sensor
MNMSVKDPHIEFNSLVTRYLSGELSENELLYFQELLSGDPGLKDQLREYQEVWDSMDGVAEQKTYDLDAEWDLIRGKIPGMGTAAKGIRTLPSGSSVHIAYRIAAVLVAGLLFSFAWIYATRLAGTRTEVAGNEPVEVHLDDGSRVLLNRDSRIRYRKHFAGHERTIRLTGEAWFEVARDTLNPFVIDAGTAIVEVLGTSFNVNAYRENPTVEITVESGVVALTPKTDQQEQIVLRAGNSGTYNSYNRQLVLVTASDPNNLSWKTGDLYFENTPLEEVAELVGRVYHTELVVVNPELASCPITVTFSDQSLQSVLSVLEMTLDLEITRSGGRILLDGTGCVE